MCVCVCVCVLPVPPGAEFETVEAPLEEPIASQYAAAAAAWNRLFREFLYAEEAMAAQEAVAAASGEGEPGCGCGCARACALAQRGACRTRSRGARLRQQGVRPCFCTGFSAAPVRPSLAYRSGPCPPAPLAATGTTTEGGSGRGTRRRGGRTGDGRASTWRSFWAAHQAFFRHMTMAAKVGVGRGWGYG